MKDILFMLLQIALVPLCMVCFGRKFMKTPPKNKNGFLSYKTDRATKTEETWTFAHKYFGYLWFRFGIAMIAVTAAVMAWAFIQGGTMPELVGGILCLLQLIPLVASVVLTERALKKCFDSYGNRIDYDDHVDQ